MIVKLRWHYAKKDFDTKTMMLSCTRASEIKGEKDANLCIGDSMNIVIAELNMGNADSSNALCDEICRRFNEFPENLKR